ncbi:MAG: quinolinate synthase NadA [Ruminococcaceae bacterium]|nr:quinolinate synthase NadA [Oscillospiraceae bacterium]
MNVREMQDEILRIKKEQNTCILAHAYQAREIIEIADFVGDSFGLSVEASKTDAKTVIMCGVRFMAETVKILSPDKKVILSAPNAGCPMAEQIRPEEVMKLKKQYPDAKVVAYINTTSELKTVCDVCVTSASALKIVESLPEKNILFIPDINLGTYIADKLPEKNVIRINGGCPYHSSVTRDEALAVKAAHPAAKLLVHPECRKEIVELADFIGSTTAIIKYAKESDAKEFIIGTELSIAEYLQYELPEKRFYPLSAKLVCSEMKLTTLPDVFLCLKGMAGEEIILDAETAEKAKKCIDEMLRLG